MSVWDANDPTFGRPLAAPLEQCAQLLGVDLTTLRMVAADVEPYLRVDGTKVWSLMQLERRLCPEAYGRVRGGYLSRRRPPPQPPPLPARPPGNPHPLARPADRRRGTRLDHTLPIQPQPLKALAC